jgi:HK97 gp10 family phage protein
MAIKAKFMGREALMKRLRQLVPEIDQMVATAQLEAAEDLAAAIEERAPIGDGDDAGDYRASIKGGRIADHPGKAVIGTSDIKDKNATGVFANRKWRWLEFGTSERKVKKTGKSSGRMPAQPHIFPTYRAKKKAIRRKVSTAINRAVRRAKGK